MWVYNFAFEAGPAEEDCMRWYHYLACFFAGVFLIHVVPHLLGGMTWINVAGVMVSLGGGGLLLWAGRFSFRNGWAIAAVAIGMVLVLIFAALRPHHVRAAAMERTTRTQPQVLTDTDEATDPLDERCGSIRLRHSR
jgi:hypothetical protein